MEDESIVTRTWSRPEMDTDVQKVLSALVADAAERAASRAVEATKEVDANATQAMRTESSERMALVKAEAIKEAKRHGRKVGAFVSAAVVAFIGAGGFGAWKLAGPEQAVERAEAAASKATEKADQVEGTASGVDRAVAEALANERASVRKQLVDGRLDSLDTRMGRVEGTVAGSDSKLDALLDAQLGRVGAREVKAEAAKVAAKREGAE